MRRVSMFVCFSAVAIAAFTAALRPPVNGQASARPASDPIRACIVQCHLRQAANACHDVNEIDACISAISVCLGIDRNALVDRYCRLCAYRNDVPITTGCPARNVPPPPSEEPASVSADAGVPWNGDDAGSVANSVPPNPYDPSWGADAAAPAGDAAAPVDAPANAPSVAPQPLDQEAVCRAQHGVWRADVSVSMGHEGTARGVCYTPEGQVIMRAMGANDPEDLNRVLRAVRENHLVSEERAQAIVRNALVQDRFRQAAVHGRMREEFGSDMRRHNAILSEYASSRAFAFGAGAFYGFGVMRLGPDPSAGIPFFFGLAADLEWNFRPQLAAHLRLGAGYGGPPDSRGSGYLQLLEQIGVRWRSNGRLAVGFGAGIIGMEQLSMRDLSSRHAFVGAYVEGILALRARGFTPQLTIQVPVGVGWRYPAPQTAYGIIDVLPSATIGFRYSW